MRRYILDTGILVHYARQSPLYKKIEAEEKLTEPDCMPLISVVSHAEILSFAIQRSWGTKKIQLIQSLLSKLIVIDINSGDANLLGAYADIDAFSKGKLFEKPVGTSAITMGKNDLWIAATAKVTDSILLTIDGDFDHLDTTFIKVKKYLQ